jgi:shikimate kinase
MTDENKHIILLGFPGSGKSTLGLTLSRILNLPFIDADVYISLKMSMSVPRIFAEYGEERFRQLESEILMDILDEPRSVIATGGGMPCFNNNMEMMNMRGTTVYMKVEPRLLFHRLRNDTARPLVAGKNKDELNRYINETLHAREKFYKQAHIVLNTFRKSSNVLAEELMEILTE